MTNKSNKQIVYMANRAFSHTSGWIQILQWNDESEMCERCSLPNMSDIQETYNYV